MNYLLLANPRDWDYDPNEFDKHKTVSYKIHKNNKKYLSRARPGERALLIITGKDREVKFEVVVSSFPREKENIEEVEFTYVRKLKPFKVDILKYHPEVNGTLFTKTGGLKQNSVFSIHESCYEEIVRGLEFLGQLWGSEESRKFFEKALGQNRHFRNCLDHYWNNIKSHSSEKKVKVRSSRDLNVTNNDTKEQTVNKLEEILRKYEVETLCEHIELEKIAYYNSYHYFNIEYGIYFNLKAFANYILSTKNLLTRANSPCLDYMTIRNICVEKVLQHERFHYLTELFLTFEELASKNSSLYDHYRDSYRRNFKTDDCLAEALANYFSKMYFIYKGKKEHINNLNTMFSAQAPGYRLAKDIDQTNEIDKYVEFEQQLGLVRDNSLYNHKSSVIFKEVSEFYLNNRLPLAQLDIDGKSNVPIYIVNDGMTESDFVRMLNLIFPRVKCKN